MTTEIQTKAPGIVPMARLLGTAVLAAGAFQLVRTIWRETAEYRASDARLRPEWTTIPALAGTGSLRLHARVRDDAAGALPPIVLVHELRPERA